MSNIREIWFIVTKIKTVGSVCRKALHTSCGRLYTELTLCGVCTGSRVGMTETPFTWLKSSVASQWFQICHFMVENFHGVALNCILRVICSGAKRWSTEFLCSCCIYAWTHAACAIGKDGPHSICGVRTSIFLLTECVQNSIETHFNTAKLDIFLFFTFLCLALQPQVKNFLRYFYLL